MTFPAVLSFYTIATIPNPYPLLLVYQQSIHAKPNDTLNAVGLRKVSYISTTEQSYHYQQQDYSNCRQQQNIIINPSDQNQVKEPQLQQTPL